MTAQRVDDQYPGFNNIFQDGDVFFAGQPRDEEALRRLKDAGVDTVINIRAEEEMSRIPYDEPAAVERLGMKYLQIPVTPKTFSGDAVDRLADALDASQGKCLIHCGSSNRVGGIWAAYLARKRGMDVDDALEEGRSAGLSAAMMENAVVRVVEDEA